MTRSILAALGAIVAAGVLSGTGCKQTGVGDPCTPEQEYGPGFLGFNSQEVNVESKSFQCETRLCLVNHFQGRVSCPYGQGTDGKGPLDSKNSPIGGCATPISTPVSGIGPDGNPTDSKLGAAVKPQCTDRSADKAVYCSCRCGNSDGVQDSNGVYCSCPDGFKCTPLVTSIGPTDQGLTGSYCVKTGTAYDPNSGAGVCANMCDPVKGNCGPLPPP